MRVIREKQVGLSIYLIKKKDLPDDEVLNVKGANQPIELDLGQGSSLLYVKAERPRPPPDWTKLFTELPNFPDGAFGRPNGVGAVLIYRGDAGTFLLSFGSGHHLINDEAVERDFGLRVTLNSVRPSELRSLDKASYNHNPLNSRTQSSKGVDIFDMAVDGESEMVYAVTGASQDTRLGGRVTGRDALSIHVTADATAIPALLDHILACYRAPLPQQFEWVENVSRVRDIDDIELFNLLLDDQLAKGETSSMWLGEPEIVDWESVHGYAFDMRHKTGMQLVLSLEALQEYLTEKGETLTVDALRRQHINLVDGNFMSLKVWSAYRCLHAEIRDALGTFVLRNGSWFKVKPSFVEQVDSFLRGVQVRDLKMPSFAHAGEGEYNLHVESSDASYICMDKKNVPLGGPYDKIEFCDLIKDGKTLIHVKYYRSSSTLSHLFAQGHVAGEAFVKDEEFRVRLNAKLPSSSKLPDPMERPDASTYSIVYAIATTKTLPDELPFFSKVTLKNAARTLRALNYQVALTQIPVDPDLQKKTVYRSH